MTRCEDWPCCGHGDYCPTPRTSAPSRRPRRELTPEQIEARDARRAKFRTLCKQIADMPELDRLALAANLPGLVTCEGHALSLHNVCLIAKQFPGASIVGGFQQWKRAGRQVRKGEHGAMIWIPTGHSKPGDGPTAEDVSAAEGESIRFLTATVFDVSQTEERQS